MNRRSFTALGTAAMFTLLFGPLFGKAPAKADGRSAHDFQFDAIDGEALPFAAFKGKVVLVVNTASQCGFTGQYAGLQRLQDAYGARGFTVLGVPSNDFGAQEPGTEAQIKDFCETNFDVTFPLTRKYEVTGSGAHPFYRWAAERFGAAGRPRWNFHKYLVGPDGQLVDWFSTITEPDSPKIRQAIEALLPKTSG